MQTLNSSIAVNQRIARTNAACRSRVAPKLKYWLPIIVVAIAAFVIDHSFRYASPSNWAGSSTVDLVAEAGGSNVFRQMSFVALGGMGIFLLLRRTTSTLTVSKPLLALVCLLAAMIAASALWADDSAQALKRAMIPLLTMTAALGLAKHWRPRQMCYFTVAVTGTLLFVGFAVACASGRLLPTDDLRFAGTLHPNSQGVNCALLSLASLALWIRPIESKSHRRTWLWLVPFGIGLLFLMLTRSRTATTALAAGCCVLLLFGASFRVRMYMLGALGFIAGVASLLYFNADSNGGLALQVVRMGRAQDTRDISSLTGRIPIWEKALHDIAARPIVGYGYGGYWTPQRVWDYVREVNWQISHVHSAYLETLLNLGVVGLSLGLFIVISAIWQALSGYWRTQDAGYLFISSALVVALVHGLLDANFVVESFAALLAMLCVSFVLIHGSQASLTACPGPVRLKRASAK